MGTNMGPLVSGIIKGIAQGRKEKSERERQAPMLKLKSEEMKLQLQEAKNKQSLMNMLMKNLPQGGGQPQQQQEPPQPDPTQFGNSFAPDGVPDQNIGPPQPEQPQPGVADQIAGQQMSPTMLALLKQATGVDMVPGLSLEQRREANKRLERQGDERIALTTQQNKFNRNYKDKTFARGNTEGSYKEVWNPEQGRMDKVWVPKYKGGVTVGGRPALSGKPNEREVKIPSADLQKWVNPKNFGAAKLGMTPLEAEASGYIKVTGEQQKAVGDFQSVFNLLDQIEVLMDEVFPQTEDLGGRIAGGTKRKVGSILQTNPSAAKLDKLIKGSMAKIIRAMGEKGTLSDGDVKRALNLFPLLTDDADVARGMFSSLKGLFNSNARAVFGQPKPAKDDFQEGAIYPGEGGTTAKYLGGGQWEVQ